MTTGERFALSKIHDTGVFDRIQIINLCHMGHSSSVRATDLRFSCSIKSWKERECS